MPVRSTMGPIITRVRRLINDPATGNSLQFDDQTIQDVLDAHCRADVYNGILRPEPTFTTGTIQYLDYYSDWTDWEDGALLKQYLTVLVAPSLLEPITGHWQFATSTLPPVMITGATYDVFRAAADLLEQLSARWMLSYGVSGDGQGMQRQQAFAMIQSAIKSFRHQSRPTHLSVGNSLVRAASGDGVTGLPGREIDRMASGNGNG